MVYKLTALRNGYTLIFKNRSLELLIRQAGEFQRARITDIDGALKYEYRELAA